MNEAMKKKPSEVSAIAVLFFVLAVFWVIGGYFLGAFLSIISENAGVGFFLISFIFAFLSILIGIGLIFLRKWAHTAALIIATISLINFPAGTALGVILLWLLLKENVKSAFGKV